MAVAPIITALAAVTSTGVGVYGAVSAEQQRQAADNEAGRQGQKRKQAEEAALAKIRDEETTATANATRDSQAMALAALAKKRGRSGTILTGALGAPSQATPGKTLLGQ